MFFVVVLFYFNVNQVVVKSLMCFELSVLNSGSVQQITAGQDDKCVRIFAASWDTTLSVWNSLDGKLMQRLSGHTNSVTGVCIDNNFV